MAYGCFNFFVNVRNNFWEREPLTFNEITYQVGYEDISLFRKIFIRLTGLRPKEYQRKFTGVSHKPVSPG
jgi:YesN/AraC family two-component response regulator